MWDTLDGRQGSPKIVNAGTSNTVQQADQGAVAVLIVIAGASRA
jgi:hypothetical protein